MGLNIITIDGPAGAGKSTVAKAVAERLGWIYVNTGSIYRTLALLFIEAQCELDNHIFLDRFVEFIENNYVQQDETGRIFLGERDISELIKDSIISKNASIIAGYYSVRARLLPMQRKIVVSQKGAIVDGRDMGTIVFPDAILKIFLTASTEERAKRRFKELETMGQGIHFDDILGQITERDERDIERKESPLKPAADAFILNSTGQTQEAVVKKIFEIIDERNFIFK